MYFPFLIPYLHLLPPTPCISPIYILNPIFIFLSLRDLKKKSKHGETCSKNSSADATQVEELPLSDAKEVQTQDDAVEQQKTQQPPKRGQKVGNCFEICSLALRRICNIVGMSFEVRYDRYLIVS